MNCKGCGRPMEKKLRIWMKRIYIGKPTARIRWTAPRNKLDYVELVDSRAEKEKK